MYARACGGAVCRARDWTPGGAGGRRRIVTIYRLQDIPLAVYYSDGPDPNLPMPVRPYPTADAESAAARSVVCVPLSGRVGRAASESVEALGLLENPRIGCGQA